VPAAWIFGDADRRGRGRFGADRRVATPLQQHARQRLRALVMASDGHLGMEDLTGAETDVASPTDRSLTHLWRLHRPPPRFRELWSACNAVWFVWRPVWPALIPMEIGGK
jgi:hypothetical protein